MELLGPLITFIAFLAIYEFLRRRAQRPVQWRWLALIAGFAAAALLIGALTR